MGAVCLKKSKKSNKIRNQISLKLNLEILNIGPEIIKWRSAIYHYKVLEKVTYNDYSIESEVYHLKWKQ